MFFFWVNIFISKLNNVGLEINERPLKRPLLDSENSSISDSAGKGIFVFPHLIWDSIWYIAFGIFFFLIQIGLGIQFKFMLYQISSIYTKHWHWFKVQHVETISSFEGTIEIVQSFVVSITVFMFVSWFSSSTILFINVLGNAVLEHEDAAWIAFFFVWFSLCEDF